MKIRHIKYLVETRFCGYLTIIPCSSPTPAIEWKDRDACRVAVGSDGAEYEGTIKVALL